MRFAIRNKAKLIKSLGEDFYNILVNSTKVYFVNTPTIPRYEIEGEKYQFIDIPNGDSIYQFAIVNERYDVLVLAYYKQVQK